MQLYAHNTHIASTQVPKIWSHVLQTDNATTAFTRALSARVWQKIKPRIFEITPFKLGEREHTLRAELAAYLYVCDTLSRCIQFAIMIK